MFPQPPYTLYPWIILFYSQVTLKDIILAVLKIMGILWVEFWHK